MDEAIAQVLVFGAFAKTIPTYDRYYHPHHVWQPAGYSLIYLLFGGGLGGAVLIFIVAKMLGK